MPRVAHTSNEPAWWSCMLVRLRLFIIFLDYQSSFLFLRSAIISNDYHVRVILLGFLLHGKTICLRWCAGKFSNGEKASLIN